MQPDDTLFPRGGAMKRFSLLPILLIMMTLIGFSGCREESNSLGNLLPILLGVGSGKSPVLNDLVVSDSDFESITVAQPTLATEGKPAPDIVAYIGIDGVISYSGYEVTDSTEGPVDVSAGDYTFLDLAADTSYRIIVVAYNNQGYSVKQIVASTAGIAPVLNDLVIAGSDSGSITLDLPTFSTAGNPAPTVTAYIGYAEGGSAISVSGSVVSNDLDIAVLDSDDHQFSGLDPYTLYKIIVVAQNFEGYSVKQIAQATSGIAPVMNDLVISTFDAASITLAKPTFSTAGNPDPSVTAYIGYSSGGSAISVSGKEVSNYLDFADASGSDHQFTGLDSYTSYKIIVVAENLEGYSVKEITTGTDSVAPVMNDLAISTFDAASITLAKPTFSTAGNPTPDVTAYIGYAEGGSAISVSGSVVSNALDSADVSGGDHQFTGLDSHTSYKIIVVANNVKGYSMKQITQSTSGIAPVLNDLSIQSLDSGSITIARPTFSTAGNPNPDVTAYIGYAEGGSSISVSGSVGHVLFSV